MKTCVPAVLLTIGMVASVTTGARARQTDAPPPVVGELPPLGRPGLGTVVPPFAMDRLGLTEEQRDQLDDLRRDTRAKLEAILTPEQLRDLRQFAERGPGGRRPGLEPLDGQGPLTNHVHITVKDGHRFIEGNGVPDHEHGAFPNPGNPNRISEQEYAFRVPLNPTIADKPTPSRILGVALNGVPFDPGTAELWNNDPNWRYEALSGKIDLGVDASNAHVQPNGAYHYHALPLGLIQKSGRTDRMVLLGYAADGFPIYNQYGHEDPKDASSPLRKLRSSYQLKQGSRPGGNEGPGGAHDGTFTQDYEFVAGSGDLDECNGREGATPENPDGTYHYVITEAFPYISRLYRGTPDPSFRRGGPPPGRRPGVGPVPGGPPPSDRGE